LVSSLKRSAFWIISRTCFTLYRWFPVFGSLRAALAVIPRDGKILIIHRADGRGFSLPGGISTRREPEETTLRREVLEETGLSVTRAELRLRYHSDADVPADISVFEAQVSGEVKDSWEGSPRWMVPGEIEPRLVESQRPVLELMRKIAGKDTDKLCNDPAGRDGLV
jgi:8-oxo-dGTP pyrophosphatase MutT (NUDIX family)